MNANGIRTQKQLQADRFLRNKVMLLHEGEALPSIRKLMEQSGLKRVVLENSLQDFCRNRLLRAEPRRGYFRTGHRELELYRDTVDIIAGSEINYMESRNSFQNDLTQQLFKIGTEYHINMRIHRVKNHEPVTAYDTLIKKQQFRAAFLIAPASIEIEKLIRDAGVRCVVVCPRYPVVDGPAVTDGDDMMELQLNHLFRNGHRRIAYLHGVEREIPQFTPLLRRECFYRMMCERGYRVPPEFVISVWTSEEELRHNLERMFNRGEPPTALISDCMHLAQVYSFFKSRRLVLGRDVSLIAEGEEFDLRPRPTAVLNSHSAMAKLAWEMMENLLAGRNEVRIASAPLSLLDGDTVANLSRWNS